MRDFGFGRVGGPSDRIGRSCRRVKHLIRRVMHAFMVVFLLGIIRDNIVLVSFDFLRDP